MSGGKGDQDESARGHTIADHLYGDMATHDHGPDADHDHDHYESLGPLEENPIFLQDNVVLSSVGMDIGSSGTQVIFSRLHMRRIGEDLTSRFIVARRETLYQSPVRLTPWRSDYLIDEAALGAVIDEAYNAARIEPADVDVGVVILTGEALRRENAAAIAGVLAKEGGEFVCATAGHHMEARLAAFGSGAARASYDSGRRILNVDIGGGTTKLAVLEKGAPVATAAIHIGGRLQVTENGVITRLDPAGRHHAARAGFDWSLGSRAAPDELETVARVMADTLVDAIASPHPAEDTLALYLTDPIGDLSGIEAVMVSGGVGEYVYGRETRDFGDMGRLLGRTLREAFDRLPWPLLEPAACIRATALGASEYTVQLSGNTGHITDPGRLLPRRNVQVLQPPIPEGREGDAAAVAAAIRGHFTAFDLEPTAGDVAVALRWGRVPDYPLLRGFAEGIRDGLSERIAAGLPLYVMLDGDVALTVGRLLAEELGVGSDLLVIDGVQLWDFDFIDLGRIRLPSRTVPVTIKSLVFNEDPRAMRPRQRLHHHDHGSGHDHHHHGDRQRHRHGEAHHHDHRDDGDGHHDHGRRRD